MSYLGPSANSDRFLYGSLLPSAVSKMTMLQKSTVCILVSFWKCLIFIHPSTYYYHHRLVRLMFDKLFTQTHHSNNIMISLIFQATGFIFVTIFIVTAQKMSNIKPQKNSDTFVLLQIGAPAYLIWNNCNGHHMKMRLLWWPFLASISIEKCNNFFLFLKS